eukprot:TRINITY_DN54716_c0_g1_i1.p1 TRINITY_DN54716_c0_g1~~TRINITY_DN54716_c0_g1_i1.p1  ORF type:complete len:116 (-),score=26.02 TRINITY_DN54716_c0_g1_i1:157-504(-)
MFAVRRTSRHAGARFLRRPWPCAVLSTSVRGCKSAASGPSSEESKKAQRVWDMMVPEQNWDYRSPMIPILIFGILVLQYLISSKQDDTEEQELQEVRRLKEEREARRAARAAEEN